MTEPTVIAWDNDFSTGVKKIDDQHKLLLAMISKVLTLNTDSASIASKTAKIMTVLDELNRYAYYHFRTEELLMSEHLEPSEATVQHATAHRAYWTTINAFEKGLQEGEDSGVINELADFLKKWWINHILVVDRQTGKALNQAGIH
ncbi:MAG: hemerythrin family protein [Proteobacteria bacterium]|nr:hemerythrin family protein [Pseudomonadota bacterium]